MAFLKYQVVNDVSAQLDVAINATDTSVTLKNMQNVPTSGNNWIGTLVEYDVDGNPSKKESVLVTGGSGSSRTITRGQFGTTATTFAVDSFLYLNVRSEHMNDLYDEVTRLETDKENKSSKDASGGYAGLTLFKINFKNAANTFTSFFTNTNTAARTYTFQDRNGTIADDTDIAAARAYADGLVVWLWDDRGNFDASGGAYPSSGGSGTAGAILKGDTWTISVAGTLPTGKVVEVWDIVRAIVNNPWNTQANWAIQQNNIGYTAENSANKATTMTGNTTSNIVYLTAKAIYDWATWFFVDLSTNQTIAGNKDFAWWTLYIDDTNNRVGIWTNTPLKHADIRWTIRLWDYNWWDMKIGTSSYWAWTEFMEFWSWASDNTTFNTKMVLNPRNWYVGIWNTNPSHLLQVSWNVLWGFLLPEWTLINGKIVPSVSSGNLTVALKTNAGTDPSATDPVYAMIGGTMRTITSALSNTEWAWANRYNLWSAELATKEVDLFAYLAWNTNLSSVVLWYSRIPYWTKWWDFSATFSNEKFLWSGTGSAVTDPVINIGRFAATLSAGPSYTWSVPTYDSSNLIQRPCYETRWLYWKPTPSASWSMTFTSWTVYDCYYKVLDTDVIFNIQESWFTVWWTVSTELYLSLPFIPSINVLWQSSEIFNGSYYLGYASASSATWKVRFAKQDFSNFSLWNTSVNTAFEFPIKIW